MRRVGIIGWRGMVGSILLNRMRQEGDLDHFEAHFFSTSQMGKEFPEVTGDTQKIKDASDLNELKNMDIILTTQGSDYTKNVYGKLKESGWNGVWIDSSSALRMDKDSIIVLDPINREQIQKAIQEGKKCFVGGNCTVSLLLMALWGLIKEDAIEWISTMTYQAASGAGAKHVEELLKQMYMIGYQTEKITEDSKVDIVKLDQMVKEVLDSSSFPKENFTVPLAGSLIPWVDFKMENGQTREEWKSQAEASKILNNDSIKIDGVCVRVGAVRSHSQAVTIKLKRDISLEKVEEMLKDSHEWLKLIPNEEEATKRELTPAKISGSLDIAIGRVRESNLGPKFINAFTVGDQLLWGAAEPLRRVLMMLKSL